MSALIKRACENVAEQLYNLAATIPMLRPPQQVLSWEQQVTLYLHLKANPVGLMVLKIQKGDELFSQWVLTMEHRAAILGRIGVNVAEMSVQEKEDVLDGASLTEAEHVSSG